MDEEQNTLFDGDDPAQAILKAENRFYEEVTVTEVVGTCPYGHKPGDVFRVTSMNSDGICGALLKAIFVQITALHYGGSIIWEKDAHSLWGCCPEAGRVTVAIRRIERKETSLLKTPAQFRNMTGKGYPLLDRYRLFVEVCDIGVTCYWGHKIGDVFEVDPFNVNGCCCFLYTQLYPFMHILLSGASPAWAATSHAVMGECPDTYDRLVYRLFLKDR